MSIRNRFATTEEVAAWLGISVRTLTAWAVAWQDSGGAEGIPAFRLGKRQWRYDPEEVERWLTTNRNLPPIIREPQVQRKRQ
jgi:excisionase family DNA binding protein